jgi:outer membrane biosynthesis protein TonB
VYVQFIAFSLDGITEEQYLDVANRVAPRAAGLPGLLAKLWLENPGANRYGAIYFWDDLESMERFVDSSLFEGEVPEFSDFTVEEFEVLENLTAMTQPALEIVPPRSTGAPPPPAEPPPPKATQATVKERTPPARTPPARKASAKKTSAKKVPAKKVPAKKVSAQKAPAKKAPAKKAAKKLSR